MFGQEGYDGHGDRRSSGWVPLEANQPAHRRDCLDQLRASSQEMRAGGVEGRSVISKRRLCL